MNVGDAVSVALNRDRSREAGDGDRAVDLRKGVVHGLTRPEAAPDEGGGYEKNRKGKENGESSEEDAAASCDEITSCGVWRRVRGVSGKQCPFGWGWIVGIHALVQSLNAERLGVSR